MAITLIGQAQANNSGTSPVSITYSSTAGNTLILTGHIFDGASAFNTPTGVTDTAGNTWRVSTSSAQSALTVQSPPLCSQTDPTDGAAARVSDWIAWCIGAAAITSVTIAFAGGVSAFRLITVSEWSGIVQFDNSWAGGSTTLSNPSVTSGPVFLSNSSELVVGTLTIAAGSGRARPAGWTQFTGSGNTQAWDLPGITGSYSPVWTNTGGGSWTGALAVFSPTPVVGDDTSQYIPVFAAALGV